MKKKYLKILILLIIASAILWLVYLISPYSDGLSRAEREAQKQQELRINELLDSRKQAQTEIDSTDDPFGEDGIVNVLLIGLDSRVGDANGHCDAIQFIEINMNTKSVQITAVPRGTYVPLPGTGHLASDYYVSKSCEIGGLEYGINQIEKIVNKKSDYVVLVGFSEVIGILRKLNLPTTQTLQWLRHRQGYTVGEPQRAHNHSTFIKQQMLRFIPTEKSKIDVAWQYLIYNLLNTDMSFSEARIIIDKVVDFDLTNNTDKITLAMKPEYKLVLVAPQNLVDDEELTEDADPRGQTDTEVPENSNSRGEDEDENEDKDDDKYEDENPDPDSEIIEINDKKYQKVYYDVIDINYDETTLDEYLEKMLDPIKDYLSNKDDYSELTKQEIQQVLIDSIDQNIDDPDFITWAYNNQVWYQIEDEQIRNQTQFNLIERYINTLDDQTDREQIASEYIIEMQYENQLDWIEKGKALLATIITN